MIRWVANSLSLNTSTLMYQAKGDGMLLILDLIKWYLFILPLIQNLVIWNDDTSWNSLKK